MKSADEMEAEILEMLRQFQESLDAQAADVRKLRIKANQAARSTYMMRESDSRTG